MFQPAQPPSLFSISWKCSGTQFSSGGSARPPLPPLLPPPETTAAASDAVAGVAAVGPASRTAGASGWAGSGKTFQVRSGAFLSVVGSVTCTAGAQRRARSSTNGSGPARGEKGKKDAATRTAGNPARVKLKAPGGDDTPDGDTPDGDTPDGDPPDRGVPPAAGCLATRFATLRRLPVSSASGTTARRQRWGLRTARPARATTPPQPPPLPPPQLCPHELATRASNGARSWYLENTRTYTEG